MEFKMSIAINVSPAEQIRRLFASGLDADDISHLTGYPANTVKEAIEAKRPQKQ